MKKQSHDLSDAKNHHITTTTTTPPTTILFTSHFHQMQSKSRSQINLHYQHVSSLLLLLLLLLLGTKKKKKIKMQSKWAAFPYMETTVMLLKYMSSQHRNQARTVIVLFRFILINMASTQIQFFRTNKNCLWLLWFLRIGQRRIWMI